MNALMAISLSALAMTLIVAVRYLLTSGAFDLMTRIMHPGLYAGLSKQIKSEIGWSLTSAAIYGLPAGIVAWGWDKMGWTLIYGHSSDYPLWWIPVSIALALFIHDSWFYWTHRLMHQPRLFRIAHAVHHQSKPPTAWAAMSFHPLEAVSGAVVIPTLVFIMPLHIGALAMILSVMTFMGISNHVGWEVFPKFIVNGTLGKGLITATHHQRHHDEYRGNYGLYFRFWDHCCGTDLGLGSFHRGQHRVGPALPSSPKSGINRN